MLFRSNDTATTEIYTCGHTLSLHDALPILAKVLHPEKFQHIDLEEEANEIFKAFLGVDGVFTEYADFLIWPREWINAQGA